MGLNIKVMSVIIILIFCLSPLAAGNLTDDNLTATDNDNNVTDVLIEDASLNDTGNDIQLSDVKEGDELADPNLSIEVHDCAYDVPIIVTIHCDDDFEGYVLLSSTTYPPMYYYVKGDNYQIHIAGNYQTRGTHKWQAWFNGDKKYKAAEAVAYQEVGGIEPNISAKVKLEKGHATFDMYANKTIKDSLEITIDDSTRKDYARLNNGHAIAYANDLAPGNHTAHISYRGNETFYPQAIDLPFEVEDY